MARAITWQDGQAKDVVAETKVAGSS